MELKIEECPQSVTQEKVCLECIDGWIPKEVLVLGGRKKMGIDRYVL
jgi:hypothetical protein